MDCLIDFVGLRGCKEVIPRSGQYINGLAGISLKTLDSLANEEQLSYRGFWNDVQTRAARRMGSDLLARVNRFVRVKSVFKDTRFGYVTDPITALPSVAQLQGLYIDFGHMRYASARLTSVGLYAMAAGTMDLLIYDFTNGLLLETIPLTVVEGYNLFTLDRNYVGGGYRRRIFVGYRGDQPLALAKSAGWTFEEGINVWANGLDGECAGNGRDSFGIGGFYGQAFGGAVPDPNAPVYRNVRGGGTFGLEIDFQVRCSADAYVCSVLDYFIDPWMNLLGAEIMLERQVSSRVNQYTTVNQDKIAGLLDFYEKKYAESLGTAVDNIQFPSDICFPCNAQVQLVFTP